MRTVEAGGRGVRRLLVGMGAAVSFALTGFTGAIVSGSSLAHAAVVAGQVVLLGVGFVGTVLWSVMFILNLLNLDK